MGTVTRRSHSAGLLAFGVIEQDEYSSWRNTVMNPTRTCTMRTELGDVIYTARFMQCGCRILLTSWIHLDVRSCPSVQSHMDSPQPSDAGMGLAIVENPALR